ncbi:MAG: hypothetical protein KDD43_09570 [Bdellovibrionales bacterium]|nr:hypothetical protein [Bdellovibrionales bacterium]
MLSRVLVIFVFGFLFIPYVAGEPEAKKHDMGAIRYCATKNYPGKVPIPSIGQSSRWPTKPFWIGPIYFGLGDELTVESGAVEHLKVHGGTESKFWGAGVDYQRWVEFRTPKESGTWQPRQFILAEDTIIQGSLIPKGSEVLLGGEGVFHDSSDVHIRLEKDATILGQKVVGPATVVIRRLKLERETEDW